MRSSLQSIIGQPTQTFRVGDRQVVIDFGEILFPAIALIFCALYYVDTRGLPEQSMMYAQWLLYATVLLAIITLIEHSISIRTPDDPDIEQPDDHDEYGPQDESDTSTPEERDAELGSEMASVAAGDTDEGTDSDPTEHFNLRTAAGLVVLTAAYFGALYLVSFVIASIGFLAIALYMFGERSPIRLVAYSVGFTLLLWAVFIQWLFVPLP